MQKQPARFVVPTKFPNKAGEPTVAEEMEGRDLAKGNLRERTTCRMQGRVKVQAALERVRQAARKEKGRCLVATTGNSSSLSFAPQGRHHLRQEPDALVAPVRIRGGGGEKSSSLLRLTQSPDMVATALTARGARSGIQKGFSDSSDQEKPVSLSQSGRTYDPTKPGDLEKVMGGGVVAENEGIGGTSDPLALMSDPVYRNTPPVLEILRKQGINPDDGVPLSRTDGYLIDRTQGPSASV